MVGETTVVLVPLLLASKYWWTSKATLLAGSLIVASRAAALPDLTQLCPPSHAVPGTRTCCVVAPAVRMASSDSWAIAAHSGAFCVCGSFIRPNSTPSSRA